MMANGPRATDFETSGDQMKRERQRIQLLGTSGVSEQWLALTCFVVVDARCLDEKSAIKSQREKEKAEGWIWPMGGRGTLRKSKVEKKRWQGKWSIEDELRTLIDFQSAP